ncbi:GntR family transcriptional regulator [Cellulomonas hominis]|uniref:GntR family transcriptional regulator n=1 Tax=Cellulomonas hominis TaxID=156981 RepID=UPI001443E3B4|nr:FadR family transcriptional regulator [Cellulomonas hominis]
MEFTPVRRVNAYELIVEQIEQGVASGALRAGDRLPGERKLMETFSVSRATVREAMRVLHATGVVDSRPGDPRGPEVLPFSAEVLEGPLLRMAQQGDASRVELLQFRLAIEGQAALLAAIRHDPADLAAIDDAVRGLDELAGTGQIDPAEFGRRLGAFHDAVRRAAGNRLVEASGVAVGGVLTRIAERRLEDEADRGQRVRRSASDAAALADRIRDGDTTGALRVATENIYRYYRDTLTPDERAALEPLLGGPTPPAP